MDKIPKLSICIPTYNRSHYLRDSLNVLIPQLIEYGQRIELAVSDNCSTDDTQAVVKELSHKYPITYYKNEKNIGANGNILSFMKSRASGEFCWIIGDDDHVREGGIKAIMDILDKNIDIDFLFVNFLSDKLNEAYKQGIVPKARSYHHIGSIDHEKGKKTFDEIIANDTLSLAGIFTSIFRVSVCRNAAQKYELGQDFTNIQSTFPETIVLIDSMKGHPCYSTGEPWLILGTKTTWSRYEFIGIKRFIDLYDYEEKAGIGRKYIDLQRRRFLMDQSASMTLTWLRHKIRKIEVPFIEEFHPVKFFLKNCKYWELWICWMRLHPGIVISNMIKARARNGS